MKIAKQGTFVASLILIDQILKLMTVNYLKEPIEVIPNFFQLYYLKNFGVGFSMLNGNKILILLISIALLYFVIKMLIDQDYIKYRIPLLMILAGGLGNLIDRIFRGFVVDYLDFQIFNYDFPVFNFADVLLVIGSVVIIVLMIIEEGGKKNA